MGNRNPPVKIFRKMGIPSIIPGEGHYQNAGSWKPVRKILNFYQLARAGNPAKEKRCSPKVSRTTLGNPL